MMTIPQSQLVAIHRPIEAPPDRAGLGYLFAAAVVNRQFRELLLKNPEAALKLGYLGERFELSREERERLTSVRVQSLAELAQKVTNP